MKVASAKKTDSLTTGDLDKIANLLNKQFDQRLAPLATKEGLKEVEYNLKAYMHEGFTAVMDGMDKLAERMAEKEKLERIMEWAREAGEKIGIKPRL